jgi:serine/threonine protein kinase
MPPIAPFVLQEHLYNTRAGSVFRVIDKNSNDYSLKVFTYSDELAIGHKERRLFDYANERTYMVNITRNACPELLESLSKPELYGKSIECTDHHVQLLLGLDVPVHNSTGDQHLIGSRKMKITNSAGDETDRVLDFTANTLLPYMAGGRLNDIISRVPRYQSMVVRYPLYVDVAPQIVDAIRYLHSIHIAHLGVQTSTILCSDFNCEDAVLSDPTVAWNGEGQVSTYANELMQQSVRFSEFASVKNQTEQDPHRGYIVKTFSSYLNGTDWDSAMKVDWYGLGGSLFYILAGIRPVAEDRTGPNSHDAAEFIYKALQSKQMLSKISTEESRNALNKIRDQVAEGLLLVDGLLQTDRSKRISFDYTSSSINRAQKTTNNLRNSKLLMSALETDSSVLTNRKTVNSVSQSTTCSAFIADSIKSSQTLAELPVDKKESLPSFIQQICQ